MTETTWRKIAASQEGLITRAQLAACGVDRWTVRNNVVAERWIARSATVIGTTTGALTAVAKLWLGVLHGGPQALLGGIAAAERHGLKNWHRDEIVVLVPDANAVDHKMPGVRFVRTRKRLAPLRSRTMDLPTLKLEPAILLWAAGEPNSRTARGILAAAVQQRLTTPAELDRWIAELRPLRGAPMFRATTADMAGGAQSVAEMDVARFCRRFGFALPRRQVRRRDAAGRLRFTDCEWELPNGQILVLEIDGAFHMEAEHWEDDLARQRALTAPGRVVVRCSTREMRDEPEIVARGLTNIGLPRAA